MRKSNINELDSLIGNLSTDYGITQDETLDILKKIIVEAWRLSYGEGYNLKIDIKNQQIKLYRILEPVKELTDSRIQIQSNGKELVYEELDLHNLPRKSVNAAKKKIGEEVLEIKRKKEFDFYSDKIGKIFTVTVRQTLGRDTYIRLNNCDGIIPSGLSIIGERLYGNIVCRLHDVQFSLIKPQLIFERKSEDFVLGLLQQKIMEIEKGVITIKKIARIPQFMTKILVDGDPNINVIGICVGIRESIIQELKGEKVHFIPWKNDLQNQIMNCFRKIPIYNINFNEELVEITVPDDKYGEVIGTNGYNIRLINKLLEKNIKIIKISEFQEMKYTEEREKLQEILSFGISEKNAIEIIGNKNIKNLINSNEGEERQNLINYYNNKRQEDLNNFAESGGDPILFQNKDIDSKLYINLLKSNIKTIEELVKFTPEELSSILLIETQTALLLLDSNKNLNKN